WMEWRVSPALNGGGGLKRQDRRGEWDERCFPRAQRRGGVETRHLRLAQPDTRVVSPAPNRGGGLKSTRAGAWSSDPPRFPPRGTRGGGIATAPARTSGSWWRFPPRSTAGAD